MVDGSFSPREDFVTALKESFGADVIAFAIVDKTKNVKLFEDIINKPSLKN